MAASFDRDRQAICQETFLRALMEGRRETTEEDLLLRRDLLGLEEMKPPFVALAIAPDYSLVPPERKDALMYDVYKVAHRFLNTKGNKAWCLNSSSNNVKVLMSLTGKVRKASEVEALCIRLREKISSQFALDAFIGIGSVVDSLIKVSNSDSEARQMLGYKYQYADSGVINIANIVRFRHISGTGNNIAFERVIGCFQDGDLGKMSVRLDELVEQIRYRPYVSKTSIRRAMVELVVQILNISSNSGVDVNEVLYGRDPYWWILQQTHTEVITEWIMQISSALLTKINQQRQHGERETVRIAREYVDGHLSDTELGLQKVSEVVGLSASYFSQMFKQETGVGINSYILMRRLEQARYLLRSTKLKNDEIARQVGFTSSSYFSQVFKKSEGISAGEYRRRHCK